MFLIIISSAFSLLSCKAQSIIVPIGSGNDYENTSDYYLKDVDNEFEKFVGTWQYQNGNSYITFKLKENEHYQISNNRKYVDLLVGEYQYVENGVEKVNTLLDFDDPAIMGYKHSINGRVFVHQLPNYCLDNSDPSEVKIELIIHHPTDEYAQGRLILRYLNDNGVEKLEACIYDYSILGDGSVKLDIPDGNYVFIKQ